MDCNSNYTRAMQMILALFFPSSLIWDHSQQLHHHHHNVQWLTIASQAFTWTFLFFDWWLMRKHKHSRISWAQSSSLALISTLPVSVLSSHYYSSYFSFSVFAVDELHLSTQNIMEGSPVSSCTVAHIRHEFVLQKKMRLTFSLTHASKSCLYLNQSSRFWFNQIALLRFGSQRYNLFLFSRPYFPYLLFMAMNTLLFPMWYFVY